MVLRRYLLVLFLSLAVYLSIISPFARYMGDKPYSEKLGLIPRVEVLNALFADYQELVGASILTKVTLYFGTMLDTYDSPQQIAKEVDYPAMSRIVHAALELDPYNIDGYYFGQSILTWDAGQHRLANDLLEYGMNYRDWDWQLPFFAAFNYAYFLNDREAAARMYMRAGELSGEPMFMRLAGRYLQEVGQTQIAIDYLRSLEQGARNPAIKKTFQLRISAFEGALIIEQALDCFVAERGKSPASIEELVATGYLDTVPVDPYDGTFYLDVGQVVRSTSHFSFATQRLDVPNTNDIIKPPVSE